MNLLRKTLAAGAAATLVMLGGATAAVAEETPLPSEPVADSTAVDSADATTEAPAADAAADPAAEAPTGSVAIPLTGVTYGSFTVSPKGPYKSGQVVTVSWTGMTPPDNNAGGGFFLGVCVGGGKPQGGPNACTTSVFAPTPPNPLDGKTWYLAGGNTLPNGSAKIVIPDQGSVAGFPDYPGWKCDNGSGNECNLALGDWRGNGPTQIPIVYGTASSGGSTSGGSTSGGSTTGGSTSGGSTSGGSTSDGGTLADTGSDDGARAAAFGLALLMLGSVLILATGRPRRGNVEA